MPARRTFFGEHAYYHVYNRGSEKRTIFLDDRDYLTFIDRMRLASKKYGIDILCYCLMPNHFHLLLLQTNAIPVNTFMNGLQLGHAKFFNAKYSRVGPLFQGRFKAKLIDSESYLLQLSGYIHKNPVASLIDSGNTEYSRNLALRTLRTFPYSSYHEYLHPSENSLVHSSLILSYFSKEMPQFTYQAFVENFTPNYEEIAKVLLDI